MSETARTTPGKAKLYPEAYKQVIEQLERVKTRVLPVKRQLNHGANSSTFTGAGKVNGRSAQMIPIEGEKRVDPSAGRAKPNSAREIHEIRRRRGADRLLAQIAEADDQLTKALIAAANGNDPGVRSAKEQLASLEQRYELLTKASDSKPDTATPTSKPGESSRRIQELEQRLQEHSDEVSSMKKDQQPDRLKGEDSKRSPSAPRP